MTNSAGSAEVDWFSGPASVLDDVGESAAGPEAGVVAVDQRLQASWPSSYTAKGMLVHLRREVHEIEQAIEEADGRPHMFKHVIEECGDAMLLLGRLALMHGAASALTPLALAVHKTERRLEHFEKLVRSMTPAEAWRIAKQRSSRG